MPHAIPYGLVARIPGFHPGGSGSIPGMGTKRPRKYSGQYLRLSRGRPGFNSASESCQLPTNHTSNLRMISFPYHHTITAFSFVTLTLNHREYYYFLKNVTVVHSKIFHWLFLLANNFSQIRTIIKKSRKRHIIVIIVSILLEYWCYSQDTENKMQNSMRWPRIELGSPSWKVAMLTTIPPWLC